MTRKYVTNHLLGGEEARIVYLYKDDDSKELQAEAISWFITDHVVGFEDPEGALEITPLHNLLSVNIEPARFDR